MYIIVIIIIISSSSSSSSNTLCMKVQSSKLIAFSTFIHSNNPVNLFVFQ